MATQLQIIEQTLTSDDTVNQLILSGSLPRDANGITEANKYIASILGEIQRTEFTDKKLSLCAPDSLRQTLIDSIRFKIPIDGRKMAHIDVRGNRAALMIDTNGFVAKIVEHYPDFHIAVTTAFEGDDVIILKDGTCEHTQRDPFCSDLSKLKGMIVKCSYTKGDRFIQESVVVNKQDLLSMKEAGKFTQSLWNKWTLERMKTAAIKRVCKWHFRQIQGLQDIIEYDNKNYDLEKPIENKTVSALDSINSVLSENIIDADYIDMDMLKKEASYHAELGIKDLKTWFESLPTDEKLAFKPLLDEYKAKAQQNDDGVIDE